MKRTRIVGCGAWDRGDDEAGLVAAAALRELGSAALDVRQDLGGGANVGDWCQGVDRLILIDAARASSSFLAGAWRRIAYPEERDLLESTPTASTHALSLTDALRLAETLGQLPAQVVIYALAGDQFAVGTGLSQTLQAALPGMLGRIREEAHG